MIISSEATEAAAPDEVMVTVVVREPFSVSHDGAIYRPGETAEVPSAVAAHWVRAEYVDRTDEPAAAAEIVTKPATEVETK